MQNDEKRPDNPTFERMSFWLLTVPATISVTYLIGWVVWLHF